MSALWCELAWLGGASVDAGVLIRVEDGVIAAVERGVARAPADAERLPGVTLPGLVSAHSHAFQRALRGRTHGGEGSFWTWREQMYALAGRLDPDRLLALARAAYGELLLAGVTLVGEFHYVHHGPGGAPYAEPNAMGEALLAAAGEAGIRITLLDACYLHGGIGRPPEGAQLRFSDGSAEAWAGRVGELRERPTARIGAAIHSVRAVDPESARVVAEAARLRDAPLHAHVSEQPAENEACLEAYGRSPTAVLADAGAVTDRFTAVHATHATAADAAALGDAGASCCLCPTTERDLADGIPPLRLLREAGVALCLGSDSHAVADLLEEARAVELDERLRSGVRGTVPAADLLAAATAGGARSLGWPEAGRVEPGAAADLAVVRLDGVRLAGAEPEHAVEALVHAGTAADVRDVMVGGRWVVRDGAHVTLDVASELRDAIRAVA